LKTTINDGGTGLNEGIPKAFPEIIIQADTFIGRFFAYRQYTSAAINRTRKVIIMDARKMAYFAPYNKVLYQTSKVCKTMNIIPLTHKHAHAYIIGVNDAWLMFDAGWPSSFPTFKNIMRDNGISPCSIRYLIVSHFHPDHAGIVQIMKEHGAALLLHECQIGAVSQINGFFQKHPDNAYRPLASEDNRVVTTSESRELLQKIGLYGEIIHTPGHSEDSVSLILDGEYAFTGDLPPLENAEGLNNPSISESWRRILYYSIKTVYPAHGLSYKITD